MTVQGFCTSGQQEEVKGAVHAAAGVLALAMATYNGVAWCYRHQMHLGVNAILYGLVVGWEIKQTRHHLHRTTCDTTARAA